MIFCKNYVDYSFINKDAIKTYVNYLPFYVIQFK